jgi:hypothetical protein
MIRNENGSCISLHHILTQEALVSSTDEASAIIESIIQENDFKFSTEDGESSELSDHEGFCRYVLGEYFGLNDHDVTRILSNDKNDTNHDYGGDDERNTKTNEEVDYETDLDDREEVIGPGECELCERDVAKLTRHHLIPKSTWKRTEPIILSRWNRAVAVVPSKAPTKIHDSGATEFDELDHLVPIILNMSATIPSCETLHGRQAAAGRRIIRDVLNHQTIDICRPCHDHIHRSYDNRTLALQFNTLNKLMNDPTIFKYAKWASRQHRFKIR